MALYLVAIKGKADNLNSIARLLDSTTGESRDLRVGSVINGLKQGIKLENVRLKDGKLYSSNGSIERYEIIHNPEKRYEAVMTILSKLVDESGAVLKYNVAVSYAEMIGDVKSLTEDKVIRYTQCGIRLTNAKIVERQGSTPYISAINGEFTAVVKKRGKKALDGKYTGELLNTPHIKAIVTETSTKTLTKSTFNIAEVRANKLQNYRLTGKVSDLQNNIEQDGDFLNLNGITLYGRVLRKLSLARQSDEIRQLLRLKDARDAVDASINYTKSYIQMMNVRIEIDAETGLHIPGESGYSKYRDVVFIKNIDEKLNIYEDVSDNEIEKYIKYLKVMQCNIACGYTVTEKKFIIKRELARDGINCLVLYPNSGYSYGKVKIEDIYEEHEKYYNAKVKDNIMIINGLDGVYKYDMDKITDTYKRERVDTKASMKAELLDIKHNDYVNGKGVLVRLYSEMKTVKIPDEAKEIGPKAIHISKENEVLVIGKNIEKSSSTAFYNMSKNGLKVIIACSDKAGENIIKSLTKVNRGREERNITIAFDRELSHKELSLVATNPKLKCNLGEIKADWSDNFIKKTIEHAIKEGLDNLKILDEKKTVRAYYGFDPKNPNQYTLYLGTSEEFRELGKKIKLLCSVWDTVIRDNASVELRTECDKLFISMKNKFKKQETEYNRLVETEARATGRIHSLYDDKVVEW